MLKDSKNRIWIGTSRGISCYYRNRFENFSVNDGLASNFIHHMMEDPAGNIWFATANGISVLNPLSRHFTNYSPKDNLPAKYIYKLFRDNRGTI